MQQCSRNISNGASVSKATGGVGAIGTVCDASRTGMFRRRHSQCRQAVAIHQENAHNGQDAARALQSDVATRFGGGAEGTVRNSWLALFELTNQNLAPTPC